jgi:hypothetical protein
MANQVQKVEVQKVEVQKVEAPKPEVQKEVMETQVEKIMVITSNNYDTLEANEWNEIMSNKLPLASKSISNNNFVEARSYITTAVNILEKKGIRCKETILNV